MDISSVCLIGGSGFVGRSIADHAVSRGFRVRVVTRSAPRARVLTVLPTCETIVANPYDEADLARSFEGVDAVVNLVGILHEGGGASFRAAHAELPRKVARAARAAGVGHLLHMSALGAAASAPSEYLRSKAEGESAVRETARPTQWTIFRPSVIFGEKDRFLNTFADLVAIFPLIPLAGASARFQPIWVEDVARCFVAAMGNASAFGQAYDLCGPRAYTLEELVRFVAGITDHRRAIVALPAPLASLQAFVFEHLPGKMITRDNLRSMSVDNVCNCPFPSGFGFAPTPLEAVAPAYLGGGRSRYDRLRKHRPSR
jgi:uncharacterized protein YbjT (DUF2867 family)